MTATIRRETLMTQLIAKDTDWTDGSNSPTYQVRIRLGLNWDMYMLASYNPAAFAAERMDETPRRAELSDGVPVTVTIGDTTYKVIAAS